MWKTTGHRGDPLEELLVMTNDYYQQHGFACVHKIATPIKVVDINKQGIITKGFFEKKSTVDFMGVIQGVAVAFDAKETHLKSLPLSNIHPHQMDYMEHFTAQGGLSFIILHFKFCDEYYLVGYEDLKAAYERSRAGGRKSLAYTEMKADYRIQRSRGAGILNYVNVLNIYVNNKNNP